MFYSCLLCHWEWQKHSESVNWSRKSPKSYQWVHSLTTNVFPLFELLSHPRVLKDQWFTMIWSEYRKYSVVVRLLCQIRTGWFAGRMLCLKLRIKASACWLNIFFSVSLENAMNRIRPETKKRRLSSLGMTQSLILLVTTIQWILHWKKWMNQWTELAHDEWSKKCHQVTREYPHISKFFFLC